MTSFHRRGPLRVAALLPLMLASLPPASAQVLEEVVVTAQRREQSIQDVGIAITALSGDLVEDLGLKNTTDIVQQVPGLSMVAWSPNLTTFNIRGVSQNNFTDNLEAPVAVYIDDVYIASMNGISAQMFDMDRVEVLRGPQGTLFGRNATGGVVHYLTRRPRETELNGYVEVGGGEFGLFSVEGALGGSFTDSVRYRVSGRTEKSDGYIKSAPHPDGNPLPPSGGSLGGTDGYAIRAALQFDIGDSSTVDLAYRFSRDDHVPTGGYSFLPYADVSDPRVYIPPEFEDFVVNVIGAPIEATPDIFFCPDQLACFTPSDTAGRTVFRGDHPDPYLNFSDYEGYLDRDMNSVTLDFTHQWDNGLELTSITNWSNLDKFYTEDGDGIPVPIIEYTTTADFTQISQEFRLAGSTDRTRWQVGAYYLDIDYDGEAITRGAPVSGVAVDLGFDPTTLTDPAVTQRRHLNSNNWSLFGQAEFDFGDAFTLIAGLRWSDDHKDLQFVNNFQSPSDGIFVPEIFNLAEEVAAAGSDADEIDYEDYAARLQLDYKLSDETLLFASFNRGIKGGNFSMTPNVTLDRLQHDEETLNAWEVGVKTTFLDGRARLNATAFYYDYKDYQAFTFLDGTPQITNAQATNLGGEIELFLKLGNHWDVTLGASLQDSDVDDLQTVQYQTTPVGFDVDWPVDVLNNVDLPSTPKYSLNYVVRYGFEFLAGDLALQLDGYYDDDQYLEVTSGGAAFQEAYGILNARVSWTSADSRWTVRGYVTNLTDEVYKQYALDLGILGGTVYYGPPQWIGGSLSYNWK